MTTEKCQVLEDCDFALLMTFKKYDENDDFIHDCVEPYEIWRVYTFQENVRLVEEESLLETSEAVHVIP